MIFKESLRSVCSALAAVIGLLVVIPFLAISLPFMLMTLTVKRAAPLFQKSLVSWREVIEFDQTVGWKVKGHLDCHCNCKMKTFHIRTDHQGSRNETTLIEADMVVFGDSYAFGYGVDNQHAYFSPQNTRLAIKPIGAPGYNMVQELILMRQLSSQLKGKSVIWFICFGNDLHDNLYPNMEIYRTPFVRYNPNLAKWEIVTSHISQDKWPYNFESSVRETEKWIGNFGGGAFSDKLYSACAFLLNEGRELCNQVGAKLTVLTVPMSHQIRSPRAWERKASLFGNPTTFDPSLPDRRIQDITCQLSIPYVAARHYLSERSLIPFDGHWNERGHKQIARLLESIYFHNQFAEPPFTAHLSSPYHGLNRLRTSQSGL